MSCSLFRLLPVFVLFGSIRAQQFGPSCPPDAAFVPIDQSQQTSIVDNINTKRNTLAGGGLSGFNSAVRMATIQWNETLASEASVTAKECQVQTDGCQNSQTFPNCGQVVGRIGYPASSTETDETRMERFINNWWAQNANANSADMASYPGSNPSRRIGAFSLLARDNQTKFGCSASRYSDSETMGRVNLLMACNFIQKNQMNEPVYVSGPLACPTGTNPDHPNLCS